MTYNEIDILTLASKRFWELTQYDFQILWQCISKHAKVFSKVKGVRKFIFQCHTLTHGTDLRRLPLSEGSISTNQRPGNWWQTHRQTHTQTDTHTDRHTHWQTHKHFEILVQCSLRERWTKIGSTKVKSIYGRTDTIPRMVTIELQPFLTYKNLTQKFLPDILTKLNTSDLYLVLIIPSHILFASLTYFPFLPSVPANFFWELEISDKCRDD